MAGRSPSWKSTEPSASTGADQAEFSAMKGIASVLDTAISDEIISGEIDDEIDLLSQPEYPAWQEQDLALEELVGEAAREINRRIEILGKDVYPFEFSNNKIRYKGSKSGFYEFCLATCIADDIKTNPFTALPRTFERATALLLRSYFGKGSRALHTGWPRKPHQAFRNVMEKLKQEDAEWIWRPQDGQDDNDIKDETLDFVVTVSPIDSRAGNLYALGQCACGNDWNTKLKEPDLKRIGKWFHPPWIIPPIKVFTTPHVIGAKTMREVANESEALVFDRLRLTLVSETRLPTSQQRHGRRRLDAIRSIV